MSLVVSRSDRIEQSALYADGTPCRHQVLQRVSSAQEGVVKIGRLRGRARQHVDTLHAAIMAELPRDVLRDVVAYHRGCADLSPATQQLVADLRHNIMCVPAGEAPSGELILPLLAMDEVYYSNVPSASAQSQLQLFGAISNFRLHRDGVLAALPGAFLYRVLVGLTPNTSVETQFPALGVGRFISDGDFVMFDYNRSRHQVVRRAPPAHSSKYRLLLKLHFVVMDPRSAAKATLAQRYIRANIGRVIGNDPDMPYAYAYASMHLAYNTATRYVIETGTNPRTFYEVTMGVLVYLLFAHPHLFVAWVATSGAAVACRLLPRTPVSLADSIVTAALMALVAFFVFTAWCWAVYV